MASKKYLYSCFLVSNTVILPCGCYKPEVKDDKIIFTKDYIIDALGIRNEEIFYSKENVEVSSANDVSAYLKDFYASVQNFAKNFAKKLATQTSSEKETNEAIDNLDNQIFLIMTVKVIGDIKSTTSSKSKFGFYLANFEFDMKNIKKDKVIQIDSTLDDNGIDAQLKKNNQEILCVVKFSDIGEFFKAFSSGPLKVVKKCTFVCCPATK